jgi:hypothetical protein
MAHTDGCSIVCGSTRRVHVAHPDRADYVNRTNYRDGVPSTISKKRYVVMASSWNTVREGKERMRVVASVANTSSNSIDISTANFLASVDGKSLKILTYEEIAQEIRSKQAWAAFVVA